MITDMLKDVLTAQETKAISDWYMREDDCTADLMALGTGQEFRQFVQHVLTCERTKASNVLGRTIVIDYVSGQPYTSAQDMRESFNRTGILKISTDFNDSPLMGPSVNLLFRAAHDLHHIRSANCEFNLDGEICAFTKFAKYTHFRMFRYILFSEIVGQVCALRHWGKGVTYAPQKTVLIPYKYIDKCLTSYKVS